MLFISVVSSVNCVSVKV